MTDYYVYSGATGTGDGSSWANAFVSLAAAQTASVLLNTNRIFIAHDHDANYGASTTLTFPSSPGLKILCVNRAGSVPPVAADLKVRAGRERTSGNFGITLNGCAYIEGMIFEPAAGVSGGSAADIGLATSTAMSNALVFKGCALFVSQTASSAGSMSLGARNSASRDAYIEWRDTQVKFGNTGSGILQGGRLRWLDTDSAIQGTAPTTLFFPDGGQGLDWEVRGVDLSALTGNLVSAGGGSASAASFIDCTLASGVTVKTGTIAGPGGLEINVVNCDVVDASPPLGYRREEYYRFSGDIVQSTAITKDGTDGDLAAFSLKMTSNSNATYAFPLELPLSVWNETTGSAVTVSVDVLADDGASLTDADVWLEVEYLGTSGSTLASHANDGAATILTTGSARSGTTDPTDWNGITTGAKSYTLSVSVTPEEKGLIRAAVRLAKASQVLYVAPDLLVA